jgi:membrane fusion protein, multidrug efflux system
VVVVAPVAATKVPIYGEFVGRTEATNTVEIRSEVAGFLQQIAFKEGALVEKGQLLFVIDPRPYETALRQARAAVAQRRAALLKAQKDVARYRPLVAQHAISREQLDTAVATAAEEAANVEAARAQVAQAELNLGYTRIKAPLAGRIGTAQVKIGALVMQGTTLLDTIYSVDPMYVLFSVSEQEYLEYQKRNAERPEAPGPLQIILADGAVYPYQGQFNMAAPAVSETTGTLGLRGEFPNPDGLLRPGLFVRVRFIVEERDNVIVVPQQAVQEVQGVRSVLVVDDAGRVAMRSVTIDRAVGDLQIVARGLRPGERVIVEGGQKVRPGMEVEVQERAPSTVNKDASARD